MHLFELLHLVKQFLYFLQICKVCLDTQTLGCRTIRLHAQTAPEPLDFGADHLTLESASNLRVPSNFGVLYLYNYTDNQISLLLQKVYGLIDFSEDHGCFNSTAYTNDSSVGNKMVAVARGSCSFSEKAMMAQKYGAAGILIVSAEKVGEPAVNVLIVSTD